MEGAHGSVGGSGPNWKVNSSSKENKQSITAISMWPKPYDGLWTAVAEARVVMLTVAAALPLIDPAAVPFRALHKAAQQTAALMVAGALMEAAAAALTAVLTAAALTEAVVAAARMAAAAEAAQMAAALRATLTAARAAESPMRQEAGSPSVWERMCPAGGA